MTVALIFSSSYMFISVVFCSIIIVNTTFTQYIFLLFSMSAHLLRTAEYSGRMKMCLSCPYIDSEYILENIQRDLPHIIYIVSISFHSTAPHLCKNDHCVYIWDFFVVHINASVATPYEMRYIYTDATSLFPSFINRHFSWADVYTYYLLYLSTHVTP